VEFKVGWLIICCKNSKNSEEHGLAASVQIHSEDSLGDGGPRTTSKSCHTGEGGGGIESSECVRALAC
jgi:hypothetical protein